MSDKKLISVVTPVYNAAPFLGECFELLLAQAGGEFEVVVVDNGSTDGSREICGEYARLDSRIRLFSLAENVGAGAARNFALDRARGDAAVFIDADDYFSPDGLRALVAAWLESGADFVRCENRIFIDDSYPPPSPASISISGPPQGKMPRSGLIDIVDVAGRPRVRYWTPCGSSLVSLDVIRRHGVRFNERMRQGEDGWFMLRLAKIPVSYHYSDTVVYNWRRHGYNSITLTSLHPLERIACKCFFYAELRKFLRGQVGIFLADRAVAHNYVSVFLEMLLLYGAWGVGADSSPAAAGILRALDDPFLRAGLDDYTPGRWVDLFAKAFAQFGWADALALLGRRYAAGAAGDWRDFSDFEYRRIVGADYGS